MRWRCFPSSAVESRGERGVLCAHTACAEQGCCPGSDGLHCPQGSSWVCASVAPHSLVKSLPVLAVGAACLW